jgi:hypothetical protein
MVLCCYPIQTLAHHYNYLHDINIKFWSLQQKIKPSVWRHIVVSCILKNLIDKLSFTRSDDTPFYFDHHFLV